MVTHTTREVARAAGLSEKAVRMYADRGLLPMERDDVGDRRRFGDEAVPRARLIRLLRTLDLSLADVATVLEAPDRVAAFDGLWSRERTRLRASLVAAEYTRSVLDGSPRLDLEVSCRSVPERLTLDLSGEATLAEMGRTIGAGTQALFDVLRAAGVDLAGSPFVVHHERATEDVPGRLTVRVPVTAVVRPTATTRLSVDPAHTEAFVALTQDQADDQPLVVAVHDHLSTGRFSAERRPCGDNREVYLPSWGSGAVGAVMEVAVPVTG